MTWFKFHSGPGEAAFNMALDETLLETSASIGQPVLRFYGWTQPAATFGYFQRYAEVERATLLRPLIRRPTGGGIVPHDIDWTYSLAVPPGHEWYALSAIDSYRRMHAWIQSAFAAMQVETELAPCCRKPTAENTGQGIPSACFIGYEKYDLLWRGQKIAGAAQRRNKAGLLIQGSVQTPLSLARETWEQAMLEVAQKEFAVTWTELPSREPLTARAEVLAAEKYSQDSYNHKR